MSEPNPADDRQAEPAEHDPHATVQRGDDERENREQIEETGEPETDALGNADGAS